MMYLQVGSTSGTQTEIHCFAALRLYGGFIID
jgi:hypothetical protein